MTLFNEKSQQSQLVLPHLKIMARNSRYIVSVIFFLVVVIDMFVTLASIACWEYSKVLKSKVSILVQLYGTQLYAPIMALNYMPIIE